MKRGIAIALAVAIAAAVIAIIYFVTRKHEGYSTVPSIFLSIASFRDDRCNKTLEEAFSKAANPKNLVVGVCEQNDKSDEMCLRKPVKDGEVRVTSIPADMATGPCTARERISRLYQGEDIFMQVDAHTIFAPNWDTLVRKAWKERPVDKAVLTTYPQASTSNFEDDVPVLTALWFPNKSAPDEVLQKCETHVKPGQYSMSRSTAGNCLIMAGQTLKDVPYDPSLTNLFNGEEILYGARLYTHGYDLLSVPYNIIKHEFDDTSSNPKSGPKFQPGFSSDKGSMHAWDILRGTYSTEKGRSSRDRGHGLGNARSGDAFFRYVGLDPGTMTSESSTEWFKKNGVITSRT